MEINFSKVHEEKEMYAVLKASVINGKEIEVKVKVHIDPIEYLGDIDNIK